jgi:hypothetical protein
MGARNEFRRSAYSAYLRPLQGFGVAGRCSPCARHSSLPPVPNPWPGRDSLAPRCIGVRYAWIASAPATGRSACATLQASAAGGRLAFGFVHFH